MQIQMCSNYYKKTWDFKMYNYKQVNVNRDKTMFK